MSKKLLVFNDILYAEFIPWFLDYSDHKLLQQLQSIPKENNQFQPLYDLDFPKPLTPKRKFYHAKINSDAISFLNYAHSLLASALNDNEKTYWINTILGKIFHSRLKFVNTITMSRQYFYTNITPANDDAYIYQYLKYQYVRLYLEIQDTHASCLDGQQLSADEILLNYFTDPAPAHQIIIPAEKINLPAPAPKFSVQPEPPGFIALKRDVREPQKGILTYHEIIKTPARFASFEEQLFEHELIDKDYNFTDKHGQLQLLAAIYHLLINKGYFNQIHTTKSKPQHIKPLDIRKFLDHRYNASVDRQFRSWSNTRNELAVFIDQYFWLTNLPIG